INIYPPILKKKFVWDGNNLIIKINEDLQDSTNYYLYANTNITGEHNNKLDKDYKFVFKSGTANNYTISGAIEYEDKTDYGKNVIINLFSADTTFIFKQTTKAYFYRIEDLNPADYVIRAFIDKNNNNVYDAEKEPFANQYISYAPDRNYALELAYQDTVKPKIVSAKVKNSTQLELNFSEKIIKPQDLEIMQDSTDIKLDIIATSLDDKKLLVVTTKMDTFSYKIVINNLIDFKDNQVSKSKLIFTGKTIQDTIPPAVISTNPRNGSTINRLDPKIEVRFSEIILTENVEVKLIEVESGKQVTVDILAGDSDIFIFQPRKNLKNWSSYKLELMVADYENNFLNDKFDIIFIPIIREL
ncbi:MAG: Ig-like domain-containing protein, partial [Candidatus Cloacimonetes bacterium]|nr:Ig-like domain-containing protein [Candidatus Cloacimonadota bacterium]